MTKDEALKLALEFIELVNKDGWILADFEPQMYEAMNAIKEALAQPEPVAWIDKMVIDVPNQILYTAPQRTWVGLTEDEAFACKGRDYFETYQAIEAKLKEKNT